MNRKKIVQWGIPILAHGIAWALAGWLAFSQPVADKYGGEIAGWLGSGILIIASIVDSFRGRAKVQE